MKLLQISKKVVEECDLAKETVQYVDDSFYEADNTLLVHYQKNQELR